MPSRTSSAAAWRSSSARSRGRARAATARACTSAIPTDRCSSSSPTDVLVGREQERERIGRALDVARTGGSAALALCGEPGIGKTALLRDAIEHAAGMTVLRCRGLEAEAALAFAGLAGLCAPMLALRERLPAAQAAALAGALQLEPAEPHARLAIGAALLGMLALAAEEQPVLCVVDDLQWLDEPSLESLRFAVRRLGAEG